MEEGTIGSQQIGRRSPSPPKKDSWVHGSESPRSFQVAADSLHFEGIKMLRRGATLIIDCLHCTRGACAESMLLFGNRSVFRDGPLLGWPAYWDGSHGGRGSVAILFFRSAPLHRFDADCVLCEVRIACFGGCLRTCNHRPSSKGRDGQLRRQASPLHTRAHHMRRVLRDVSPAGTERVLICRTGEKACEHNAPGTQACIWDIQVRLSTARVCDLCVRACYCASSNTDRQAISVGGWQNTY